MRRQTLAIVAVAFLAFLSHAPARAQYMYLDSNGDGVHTAADHLPANGTPVDVDVWLRTDTNRDGSSAVCPTADGLLTINSYVVNLAAAGGTVSFTNFVNQRSAATVVLQPFNSDNAQMTVGRGGGQIEPPGTYKLMTITVTPLTGNVSLNIASTSSLQSVDLTSFGSQCSGNDFDNTMKLGSDWFDTDGLPGGEILGGPPSISVPAVKTGVATGPLSVTATASDPDAGDVVTLSRTTNAPFLTGPTSVGPTTNPSLTLSGTPSAAQAGSYSITWNAVDNSGVGASASTAVLIAPFDTAPVVTAPATATGVVGAPITVTATASDADAQSLTLSQTNNSPFFPPSSSAGPVVNPSLSVTGTPSVSGSWAVQWTAVESAGQFLTATASTSVFIGVANRAPVIVAPPTVTGTVLVAVSVVGSASDPDGQNVTLSQTNNAPFLAGPASAGPSLNPSITLTGTPNFSQKGAFTINWNAVDTNVPAGSTFATTSLAVPDHSNRNPVIIVPLAVVGTEGVPVSITAAAGDPDGELVTLCVGTLPGFLTGGPCAAPALSASLTVTGTPGLNAAGGYTINWSASDGAGGSAVAATSLRIADSNRPPVLDPPTTMTVSEGTTATQQLTASDPDGDALTFRKALNAPVFLTVSTSGLVTLMPGFSDAGNYVDTVFASDGNLEGGDFLFYTVVNVNHCPTAIAGGPYSGVAGVPIVFDGSASSDPDGDLLGYRWEFGDGGIGQGASVLHAYSAAGTYAVTLTVEDAECPITASASATVASQFAAGAFTSGGNTVTSLGSGKPFTCVHVQPSSQGTFDAAQVDLTTVKMVSMGTGSVTEISADPSKSSIGGDKDDDGIAEVTACFGKADLRNLFSGLPGGRNTVTVTIIGSITSGGSFAASLTTTVKSSGGGLAASISPNPMNPSATLSFVTTRPGAVRIQVFDLSGRLVRRVRDESQVAAGWHDVAIDARGADDNRLTSGVYFLKIWTQYDGEETKSFTVLK